MTTVSAAGARRSADAAPAGLTSGFASTSIADADGTRADPAGADADAPAGPKKKDPTKRRTASASVSPLRTREFFSPRRRRPDADRHWAWRSGSRDIAAGNSGLLRPDPSSSAS